jgi:hypothetical protein
LSVSSKSAAISESTICLSGVCTRAGTRTRVDVEWREAGAEGGV